MMSSKRTGIGVALVVLGVLVALVPSVGPNLPMTSPITVVIGLIVMSASLLYLKPGANSSADPPTVEKRRPLPSPGDEIEEQLRILSREPLRPNAKERWKDTHSEFRPHLRTLALQTLVNQYNLNEARAEELLDTGAWSEDPQAVAFFAGSSPDDGPVGRKSGQTWFSTSSPTGRQAKHVIDELGAIERGERLLSEIGGETIGGDDSP